MAGYCTLVLYFHSPAAREIRPHTRAISSHIAFSPIKYYIYIKAGNRVDNHYTFQLKVYQPATPHDPMMAVSNYLLTKFIE